MKFRSGSLPSGLHNTVSLFALLFICSFMSPVYASEEDYLKSLEAESQKIRDTEDVGKDTEATEDAATIDTQRDAFDAYMKAKYKGTYTFYRKLPESSREEIFKAFVDGASMKEIRNMVIDRKMNR